MVLTEWVQPDGERIIVAFKSFLKISFVLIQITNVIVGDCSVGIILIGIQLIQFDEEGCQWIF